MVYAPTVAAVFSLCTLIFILTLLFIGPELCSFEYDEQNLENQFLPPGEKHWFGTDNLGRDLLPGQVTEEEFLAVGLLATLVSLVIGVTYGMVSGYIGGKVDAFMMRFVDILYSLPFTIFVILLMVLFSRKLLPSFSLAIGAVEWLTMARITRAQTLHLKNAEFIVAHALGYKDALSSFIIFYPISLARLLYMLH